MIPVLIFLYLMIWAKIKGVVKIRFSFRSTMTDLHEGQGSSMEWSNTVFVCAISTKLYQQVNFLNLFHPWPDLSMQARLKVWLQCREASYWFGIRDHAPVLATDNVWARNWSNMAVSLTCSATKPRTESNPELSVTEVALSLDSVMGAVLIAISLLAICRLSFTHGGVCAVCNFIYFEKVTIIYSFLSFSFV